MIRIAVVARQGVMLDGSQMAEFGSAGGTIGRADTNTLVLSDPERTVSRVHAQVLERGGQYFIVDHGSNPLQCNGVPVGDGREVALHGGERLLVGTFELLVESAAGAGSPVTLASASPNVTIPAGNGDDDPFADLLVGLPGQPSTPSPAPQAMPQPPAMGAPQLPDPFADPLMGIRPAVGSVSGADPFADLLAPTPAGTRPAGVGGHGLMGDDFSDLGLPGAAAPIASAQRIDDLFGGMGGGLSGADPLALSPLADPLRQPNTGADPNDPFAALGQRPEVAVAPRADHVPIGESGFTPPIAVQPPPPAPVQVLSPTPTPPSTDIPEPAPVVTALPPGLALAPPPAPQAAGIPPAISPTNAAGSSGDGAVLLQAFLRGVGGLQHPPTALTPELMERIGVLLRCATEGTLQLLLARQELKREVRAEVTMIGTQANNPLKFSPTAEVALAHLLGPGMRGFMGAEDGMRDAYDDLRAHQFGVMVGMRAALEQLIERFSPPELEKKIAARSTLDSLFAAGRKAKLWDQFVALYATIAAEAEDDFHTLFGKAFLKAYETQMAQLQRASARPPG